MVFFDEVNTATPATQNALMRVVLEGRVGDLELGDSVRFAAAANPPSQNSAAWDSKRSVGEPASRTCHGL